MNKMYTLGIPNRQKKRALGYLKQNWINFEESPSMDGFIDLKFPELDEEGFRNIAMKLKYQGVTLMGVDSQLTERKMKKLIDLMNEVDGYSEANMKNYPLGNDDDPSQGFESDAVGDIMYDLKRMLEIWETKKYDSAEERYKEYYLDVEELVQDYEMGMSSDYEDKMDDDSERAISVDAPDKLEEQIIKQIRKKIRKEIQKKFK
jgi:hypothetical protein